MVYLRQMDVLPLLQELDSELPAGKKAGLQQQLAQALNELLLHDFRGLVQLLYQVDVPERKLKAVIRENPGTDAGELLAGLLLQRQEEKKKLRMQFRTPPPASDEDRW